MLKTPEEIQTFVKAGKAIITLRSTKTGRHFTYKVTKVDEAANKFFVSLLTGQDNESSYSYLGLLTTNGFHTTARSCASASALSAQAFTYFCASVISQGRLPATLEVRHEGRCGACGRKLTTPTSIDRGIGPECWDRLGGGA